MKFKRIRAIDWSNPDIKLDDDTVLILGDHFGDEYSDEKIEIPKNITVFNHYSYYENTSPDVILLLGYFLKTVHNFKNYKMPLPSKSCCFNFMINKGRVNRKLLLAFINYFELTSYMHTWTWTHKFYNDSSVLEYLHHSNPKHVNIRDLIQKGFDTSRNHVDLKFLRIGITADQYARILPEIMNTAERYRLGLGDMFEQSVVSLITEPVGVAKAMMFTEKTAFAMVGLTFPLWVGGYKQAQEFERFGFNVFHNVIDHSYQFEENFVDRCFVAIRDNLQILTNFEYAHKCWNENLDALQCNQQHLVSQNLVNHITAPISHFSEEVKGQLLAV